MQKVSQNWQSWLSPNLRKQRAVRKKEATHRSVVFTQKRLCVASFFHRANARQRGKTKFFELPHCGLERGDQETFFLCAAPTRRRGKLSDISKNHNPHFHDIEFTYEIILKKLSRNRETCGIMDKNMAVNYLISQVADS